MLDRAESHFLLLSSYYYSNLFFLNSDNKMLSKKKKKTKEVHYVSNVPGRYHGHLEQTPISRPLEGCGKSPSMALLCCCRGEPARARVC